jgi:hypothetical protein
MARSTLNSGGSGGGVCQSLLWTVIRSALQRGKVSQVLAAAENTAGAFS